MELVEGSDWARVSVEAREAQGNRNCCGTSSGAAPRPSRRSQPCGVDVRGNDGGKMWTIPAGDVLDVEDGVGVNERVSEGRGAGVAEGEKEAGARASGGHRVWRCKREG